MWGTETREVIETHEGRADHVIAFHDQVLASDERRRQKLRLQRLLRNPEAAQQEHKQRDDETKRRINLLQALPDAVTLNFAGTESNGWLRFDFAPNSQFAAKSR